MPPPEKLFIYEIEGRVYPPDDLTGDDFLGCWREGDYSYLFFGTPREESVKAWVATQDGARYSSESVMNYADWEAGQPLELFYLGQIGTYFLVSGLAMIFGAMMTRFAVRLMGKKWSFITSLALVALTAIPFYFIRPDQMPLVYTFQLLGMFFAGINATLFWAMVADTADFQEWKYKVRTTGVAFSATTCAQKAGMGIGAAIAGYLISYFGYDPKATVQSPAAIHGILLLISLIPAVGLLLLSCFFTIYGLNEHICKTMREDLAQRRGQELPRA